MTNKKNSSSQNLQDTLALRKSAKEESRYEDAITHFQAALKMKPSGEDEVRIRCELAESFERRGMHHEQLEAVSKYDDATKLSQFSEHLQIILRIQFGR